MHNTRVLICVSVFSLAALPAWGDVSADSASPAVREILVEEAERFLGTELQPGTLILHRGECIAVKVYTQSPYTHVGLLMPDPSGKWQVYDSANGVGVRKTALATYLRSQTTNTISLYHPVCRLSPEQCNRLNTALEQELGRPYGIRHFLTGESAEGMHCSEYVTTALRAVPLISANKPARVSPNSLRQGVEQARIYCPGSTLKMVLPNTLEPSPQGWCSRLWNDTQHCTLAFFGRLRRSVLCRE